MFFWFGLSDCNPSLASQVYFVCVSSYHDLEETWMGK